MSQESKKRSTRRQHARVTIDDVARRAGVSPMTVSRAINGETSVRVSTRAAIDAAIKELGYFPNKAARSLASADQVEVGLVYSNPSASYLSSILLGALEEARVSDTLIVVVECREGDDPLAVLGDVIDKGVDGIVLAPPLSDESKVLEFLKRRKTPVVTIGTLSPKAEISSVSIDDCGAAYAMTRHLIELGHRRIGFIEGSRQHTSAPLRTAGFRDAMKGAGLEIDEKLVVEGDFSYRSGLEAAERLLTLDSRPSAIFASNDDMAAATVATAHRFQIQVPEQLTVCGFDDTLLATAVWPEITTVRQPIADMSHAAIDVLSREIRERRAGNAPEAERVTLEFSLVHRASDAPPAN